MNEFMINECCLMSVRNGWDEDAVRGMASGSIICKYPIIVVIYPFIVIVSDLLRFVIVRERCIIVV